MQFNSHSQQASFWPKWLWITVGTVALVDAIWLITTPISLTKTSFPVLYGVAPFVPLMLMGTWVPTSLQNKARLRTFAIGMGTLLAAWPTLRIYNHLTMTTKFPLADTWLASADRAIGFDWLTYITWLDQHSSLIRAMSFTYTGLTGYSIILFLVLLFRKDAEQRCAEFVKMFIVTAVACSTIGMFFPALTAAVHYAPESEFLNFEADVGAYHLSALNDLRSNQYAVLDIDNLPGLVTFPSFHTAMGVIAIYCSRNNLAILLPSALINTLMIASTPLFGSHYAIDIIAGIVVAAVVIYAHRKSA